MKKNGDIMAYIDHLSGKPSGILELDLSAPGCPLREIAYVADDWAIREAPTRIDPGAMRIPVEPTDVDLLSSAISFLPQCD